MIFDWMGLGEEVVWVLNMLEMPRLRPDALKGGESGYLASGEGGVLSISQFLGEDPLRPRSADTSPGSPGEEKDWKEDV